MAGAIYLDIDDEITSAVARIRGAPAGAVVLVVPFGSRLASSRINFRLLAREAAALRRHLVIVAPEPATRALAASAGLPTHATVMEYEASAEMSGAEMSGVETAGSRTSIRDGGPARGSEPAPATPERVSGVAVPMTAPPPPQQVIIPPTTGGPPARLRGPAAAPPIPFVGPVPRGAVTRTRVVIALVVVALLASVVGVAAISFLPSAEITVTPVSEAIGPLALTVTADPAATTPDPTHLIVPATRLSVPVSVNGTFQATGKQVIDAKATGSVTFQSCDTGGTHQFAAGTTLKTADGIAFTTDTVARLDRAKITGNTITCPTATVPITASKSGPESNVAANTIKVLPAGTDTIVLSVTNPAPTSGGVHQENPLIQKSDVDTALASLRTKLNDAFTAKLVEPGVAPAGTVVVSGTQRLGDPSPTVDTAALVNQQRTSFDLGLSATGTAIAVDPGPVTSVAEAKLKAGLGDGYEIVAGSVKTTVDPPVAADQLVTFAVRVRGERVRSMDRALLLSQVLGKSIAAARSILAPYGDVRISVWPDWVTAIPGSDSRVKLTIAPVAPGASPSPGAPAGGSAPAATTPGASGAGLGSPTTTGGATLPAPSPTKRP